MIIVCAYCKKVMGYKCWKCGDTLEICVEELGAGICNSCDTLRSLDKGGTSHSICPGCAKEQKGKLEEGK